MLNDSSVVISSMIISVGRLNSVCIFGIVFGVVVSVMGR